MAMNGKTDPEDDMDAIEELLPWYAAGTLDPQNVRRVEEALAREPRLQASLRLIREDQDETIALNQSLGAPGGQAWARVLAACEAEPKKPSLATRLASLVSLAGRWAEQNPRRLGWATVAAAVVIMAQGATIMSLLPTARGPTYQTASQESAISQGVTILVAFAPDARLDQVAELLQKHNASIVEGPRGGGLFRVRVGDKGLTKDQLAAIVAEFRSAPIVSMVLPSSGP